MLIETTYNSEKVGKRPILVRFPLQYHSWAAWPIWHKDKDVIWPRKEIALVKMWWPETQGYTVTI